VSEVFRAFGVGKRYWVSPTDAMGKRGALNVMARPAAPEALWAIKDVDISLAAGETLGLLGRNGAGKTTFLRLLAQTTAPTKGELRIRGRVGAMLGAEAAFSSHLTGRENCFLTGAILGIRRAEVSRQLDAIIAFAEIEEFIDVPVRYYSSGMYLRLAIALSLCLRTEILAVDEALNACDEAFRRKAIEALRGAALQGRAIVIVSHDLSAIRTLCSRAVLLDRGRVVGEGDTSDVIAQMRGHGAGNLAWQRTREASAASFSPVREIRLHVNVADSSSSSREASYALDVALDRLSSGTFELRATLESDAGEALLGATHRFSVNGDAAASTIRCEFGKLPLRADWYAVSVSLHDTLRPETAQIVKQALHFRIDAERGDSNWFARPLLDWQARFTTI
jgi:ABC-type polysaccharide/polyol phosphate transport system ATPase subunit